MTNDALIRSWLYVPAHKERMIAKSLELPADAVVYDYEDAVPPAEKVRARSVLAEALPAVPAGGLAPPVHPRQQPPPRAPLRR